MPELIRQYHPDVDAETRLFLQEFALHGMAEFSLLSKHLLKSGAQFKDLLSTMLSFPDDDVDEERGFAGMTF